MKVSPPSKTSNIWMSRRWEDQVEPSKAFEDQSPELLLDSCLNGGFLKSGYPKMDQNGWFIMEIPTKMYDLGVPHLWKPPNETARITAEFGPGLPPRSS